MIMSYYVRYEHNAPTSMLDTARINANVQRFMELKNVRQSSKAKLFGTEK